MVSAKRPAVSWVWTKLQGEERCEWGGTSSLPSLALPKPEKGARLEAKVRR